MSTHHLDATALDALTNLTEGTSRLSLSDKGLSRIRSKEDRNGGNGIPLAESLRADFRAQLVTLRHFSDGMLGSFRETPLGEEVDVIRGQVLELIRGAELDFVVDEEDVRTTGAHGIRSGSINGHIEANVDTSEDSPIYTLANVILAQNLEGFRYLLLRRTQRDIEDIKRRIGDEDTEGTISWNLAEVRTKLANTSVVGRKIRPGRADYMRELEEREGALELSLKTESENLATRQAWKEKLSSVSLETILGHYDPEDADVGQLLAQAVESLRSLLHSKEALAAITQTYPSTASVIDTAVEDVAKDLVTQKVKLETSIRSAEQTLANLEKRRGKFSVGARIATIAIVIVAAIGAFYALNPEREHNDNESPGVDYAAFADSLLADLPTEEQALAPINVPLDRLETYGFSSDGTQITTPFKDVSPDRQEAYRAAKEVIEKKCVVDICESGDYVFIIVRDHDPFGGKIEKVELRLLSLEEDEDLYTESTLIATLGSDGKPIGPRAKKVTKKRMQTINSTGEISATVVYLRHSPDSPMQRIPVSGALLYTMPHTRSYQDQRLSPTSSQLVQRAVTTVTSREDPVRRCSRLVANLQPEDIH